MTTASLAHIFRHPIKSVGWQALERVVLTQDHPLPFDRQWAVSTQGAPFDGDPKGWHPKMHFLRGAASGELQAIQAEFDETTQQIVLRHPNQPDFTGRISDDSAALVSWLKPLWPSTRPEPKSLVRRTDGGALSDVPEPYVSLLSTKSLRILSRRMNRDLSMHRFRGNFWVDGLAPWEEFDLIDRDIQIGEARLRVEARITRCVATTFDPETGQKSGDPLAALDAGWQHTDFGVYARVIQSGTVQLGDPMTVLT